MLILIEEKKKNSSLITFDMGFIQFPLCIGKKIAITNSNGMILPNLVLKAGTKINHLHWQKFHMAHITPDT